MSDRIRKVNALIHKEMSRIMTENLSLKPGLFLTISKIDTTDDLRYTRIFVRVFPGKESEYGMKTLEHERFTLQKQLHKKLQMKVCPKISFANDTTGDEVDEIERLLKES